jgi:hypothetical protein
MLLHKCSEGGFACTVGAFKKMKKCLFGDGGSKKANSNIMKTTLQKVCNENNTVAPIKN